ncbi:MAG: succinate:quinone oxidoreductase, partial [Candidatus Kapabacteria bacterium]|nr:succinate:quinone oxidoreductase [Candidatus Kapabacteria bacterium]
VYIVYVTFVLMHLSHAIASSIQTLGFNHPRYYSQLKNASNGLSLILWIGYVSIPLAVLLKYITPLG